MLIFFTEIILVRETWERNKCKGLLNKSSKVVVLFCCQLVYFRTFSFVYISHVCALFNEDVCHACFLRFAAAKAVVTIIFILQRQ